VQLITWSRPALHRLNGQFLRHVCNYVKLNFGQRSSHPHYERGGGLVSLWLYKANNKLRDKKMYLLYIFPLLSSTHLWLRCSNFFNPSKKNSFACAANRKIGNRKGQRLISTFTYYNGIFIRHQMLGFTDLLGGILKVAVMAHSK
jgi:hypothetical protein